MMVAGLSFAAGAIAMLAIFRLVRAVLPSTWERPGRPRACASCGSACEVCTRVYTVAGGDG